MRNELWAHRFESPCSHQLRIHHLLIDTNDDFVSFHNLPKRTTSSKPSFHIGSNVSFEPITTQVYSILSDRFESQFRIHHSTSILRRFECRFRIHQCSNASVRSLIFTQPIIAQAYCIHTNLDFETINARTHRFEILRSSLTSPIPLTFNIDSGEDRYEGTFHNNHQALTQFKFQNRFRRESIRNSIADQTDTTRGHTTFTRFKLTYVHTCRTNIRF
jgi:hypothetical protein